MLDNVYAVLVMMVHDQKNMNLKVKNLDERLDKNELFVYFDVLFSLEEFFDFLFRKTRLTVHCSFQETLLASSRYIFNIQSLAFPAMIGYVNKNRSLCRQQGIVIYVYVIILRTCQHSYDLRYII